MKQYCRYCSHLVTGNGIWCMDKEKTLSEAYTKTVNNCKRYADCEIDAYTLEHRKERKEHQSDKIDGQISLTVLGGLNYAKKI